MHPRKLPNRILWLAVAGIALRAIVPAGYMPAPLTGGLPFAPCPGGLPYFAAGDSGHDHTGDANHNPGSQHDRDAPPAWQFCPFGVFFSNAGLVADYHAPSLHPGRFLTFAEPDVIVRPALARSWRARAPPA